MNKKFAITRIIASSILAIVSLFILVSLILGNFSPTDFIYRLNSKYNSTNELTAPIDSISKIDLRNFGSELVTIYPTDSNEVKLLQSSTTTLKSEDLISISKEGNSLIFTKPNKIRFFSVKIFSQKIDLYIPKDYSEDLSISMSSGKLSMDGLNFKNLDVYLSSGTCDLKNITTENTDLRLSSGTLNGKAIKSNIMATDISSGKLVVEGEFSNIDTQTSSGSTRISSKITPESLTSKVSSGKTDISIPDTDGFEVRYKRSSGSIVLDFPLSDFNKDNKSGVAKYKDGGNTYNLSVSSGKITLGKL